MGQSGGQAMVQSGPSMGAVAAATQDQITASQVASQAAAANTNSAINALMGQYATGLQMSAPAINTGNQAMAQMNYMMGLPAIAPGVAPVAPTAPTLASLEGTITPAQRAQYVQQNSNQVANTSGSYFGNSLYSGVGSVGNGPQVQDNIGANSGWMGDYSGNVILGGNTRGVLANPNVTAAVNEELAKEALPQAQQTWGQQEAQYQQQLQSYNNANNLYNTYQSKGTATPGAISNIVSNLPGFQFQNQQGLSAIQNAASASGSLNSGNLLESLNQFGQGLASQYYQNYMGNLGTLSGAGQAATANATNQGNALGQAEAGLYNNLGTTQANAALTAGQAMASSYLSPLANQQTNVQQIGGGGGGMQSALGGVGLLGSLFSGGGGSAISGMSSFFSSKILKTNYSPAEQNMTDKLMNLPIGTWEYIDSPTKHIGPYAETFKETFNVGDGKTIQLVDAIGVLLKTVQELTVKVNTLTNKKIGN